MKFPHCDTDITHSCLQPAMLYKIKNTYYRQRYQVHRQLLRADPELQKVPDRKTVELPQKLWLLQL